MPLQKLQFRPGLNREGTNYSNEGGYYDGDKIRFRSGFPEKIGGWIRFSNNFFLGICRSLWNWVDLVGNNYIGVGTNIKYYLCRGGSFYDITPIVPNSAGNLTTTLTPNPFACTLGSSTITVTDTVSGIAVNVGDYVIFTSTTQVGGMTIAGEYVVTSVLTAISYQIQGPTASNATGVGGGTVTVQYEYPTGNVVYSIGTGWGAASYSPTNYSTLGNNAFATTNNSNVVTVTAPAHGLANGQYAAFTGAVGFAGFQSAWLNNTFVISGVTTNTFQITVIANANAGSFSIGQKYAITATSSISPTTGLPGATTNFTSIGAANNNIGTVFTATDIGAGSGTASVVATSTTSGGGAVTVFYPQYGNRGWNTPASTGVGTQLRLWTNDNFGQDLVIAPRGGKIYYWVNATGPSVRAQDLETISTGAGYQGQFCPNYVYQVITSAIQRFVIAFGSNPYDANNPNNAFNPMLVRWSDQGNAFQWVPDVTNQSGEFPLANGSYIVGSRATRQEMLIWTDSCLYSMQYIGAPYVWGFQILMDNISIMSPNCMITINNVTYWMGLGKFYQYSGVVQTLPCSLRQYIFDDINLNQSYQVFAAANEGFNEIWWFYVSSESQVQQVDKYVVYNYLDRVWYYGTMARSAWLDIGIQTGPIAANYLPSGSFTGSISGNVLTVINVISGFVSLDVQLVGAGVTQGTRIISQITGTGGVGTYQISIGQNVAATNMTTSGNIGYLIDHEIGNDDVAGLTPRPITAFVQSSDFDIGDGMNFGFVWRILPDVNFNGSENNNPQVTMTVIPRVNSGTPYGQADNPKVISQQDYTKYSSYTVQLFTGQVYTRLRGRQMAFRIESDNLGVAWQLGSPRIDIRPDGRR